MALNAVKAKVLGADRKAAVITIILLNQINPLLKL
jgi:hypothetical protein